MKIQIPRSVALPHIAYCGSRIAFVSDVGFIMEEIWKDIKGYEGSYQVSNYGRVKSLNRKSYHRTGYKIVPKRILKPTPSAGGYMMIKLLMNGKGNTRYIHRLVWDHFGDKPRNGSKLQIDHIDNDKLNNCIDNLQLLTQRQNTTKAYIMKQTSSQFIGVSPHGSGWMAQITIKGRALYLGTFHTEIEASEAYQKKLSEITF